MEYVVGIKINESDKIKYFYTNDIKVKENITVIVEEDGIKSFGKVVTKVHPINSKDLKKELGKIIRIASKKDYNQYLSNQNISKEAFLKCKDLIKKSNLDMSLVDANLTFDKDQLIFRFLSDDRVDFRNLARDLAKIYKVRIELRQIGVRDKSKEIGGIGSCGQELCCHRFLNEFDSVSISMAKNQDLALNPTKVNGLCGRLLCCLKYENECYLKSKKGLPKVGDEYKGEDIRGKVVSVNILKRSFKVEVVGQGVIEVNL